MVERMTVNHKVIGSIPIRDADKLRCYIYIYIEFPRGGMVDAADLKSVLFKRCQFKSDREKPLRFCGVV